RLASELLTTPLRSDALQIKGQIAHTCGRNDQAVTDLEEASRLHRREHRPREVAGDDGLLALIRAESGQFFEALQAVDECIAQAQLAHDTFRLGYCHLTAAKTLTRIGYWRAAEREAEI